MKENQIIRAYEDAREIYASYGVDTDKAFEALDKIRLSVHCWQGDDVTGFEGGDAFSQNVVTGSYPGRARNADELRADLETAFSLSPLKHKVNLHSMYGEGKTERKDVTIKNFERWLDWAAEKDLGLDFNASFFTHSMMKDNLSLTSPDKAVRDYWIEAGIGAREISLEFGKRLGIKSYNNIWIPDGLKDIPADRFAYRQRLIESLDKIFAKKYSKEEKKFSADTLEGKLFGIGTESFVVGSHEFYMGYAIKNGVGICLDTGHFHPTESVADKISSLTPFVSDILLHVSRGVRWDSDHVVIQSDELYALMTELRRGNLYDKTGISLDYFDATINRIAAWVIGIRATARAILYSLLEPFEQLKKAENEGDFTSRLALIEEFKSLPFNAVWDYYLFKKNVCDAKTCLRIIKDYENAVLSKR